MMAMLRAVEALELPDAWIGAGFVRNAVWDVLHGRAPEIGTPSDTDVVFVDTGDRSRAGEEAIERALCAALPGVIWSVRNQARMHLRNGDAPYTDTADAVAHWPETATAVAVRVRGGAVELLAPYAVGDLVGLVVRPTPPTVARAEKMAEYRKRVAVKGWLVRWPRLVIADDAIAARDCGGPLREPRNDTPPQSGHAEQRGSER